MKTIADLRQAAFDMLQELRTGKLDIAQAKAGNDLLRTLVDSAKVEVDYLSICSEGHSEFLQTESSPAVLPQNPVPPLAHNR